MIVLIRADASTDIGSGHVMRCAALGARLMAHGASIHFVCVGLDERLADWLRKRGFSLTVLSDTKSTDWHRDLVETREVVKFVGHIDLLIVDHYRLGLEWERGMRPHVGRILVIDDLADRKHDCDLLLDQSLHDDAQSRYSQYVSSKTIKFFGPSYALLRPEFDEMGLERIRDGNVNNLLVFFGGTDPGNQTRKVVDALRALGASAPESIIVLGPLHPYRDIVHKSVSGLSNIHVLDATDRMSALIAQADLAIGTCGAAAWERCALGLPCLVVVTAENQREDAEILHRLGAVENLGDAEGVSAKNWETALRLAMNDPFRLRSMALAASEVMAGRSAALAELEKALVNG